MRFTDEQKYFVSEASVYRLLKAHDLVTSPGYVVIKAANEFKDKTTAINQLWQTDFTYRAPRSEKSGRHMFGMHGERRNLTSLLPAVGKHGPKLR